MPFGVKIKIFYYVLIGDDCTDLTTFQIIETEDFWRFHT